MSPRIGRMVAAANLAIGLAVATAVADPGAARATPSPSDACDLLIIGSSVCKTVTNPGAAVSSLANSAFDKIVGEILAGFGRILEWTLAWWVKLPSPQLETADHRPTPVLTNVQQYTGSLQVLLMTGAVMFCAARLVMARRGGLAGEAQETFLMFARANFASWMFAAVVAAGTRFGDGFSNWVITDVTHGDAAGELGKMMVFDNLLDSTTGLGAGAMFFIGTFGLLGALMQLVLLAVRQALLIVVVALIPVAASLGGTAPGSQAYKKLISWSIGFLIYKPVGALVYVVAFTAAGSKGNDPQLQLLGMILLALVALVLPSIMRVVAPAVASMGAGGGGAAGTAMLAGAAGMAAQKAMSGSGGSGSGGRTTQPSTYTGGPPGGGPPGGGAAPGGRQLAGTESNNTGNGGATGGGNTGRGTGTGQQASKRAGQAASKAHPYAMAAQAAMQTGQAAMNQVRSSVAGESAPDESAPGPGSSPREVRR